MQDDQAHLPGNDDDAPPAIAIIGMAGRFPGARDVAELWRNLCEGREGITFFTPGELAAAGVSRAEIRHPAYVPASPILDDVELFDAEFFGMNRPEAESTDPQQRFFLECAWEALEDAGVDPQRVGGPIGVYAGCSLSTYLFFNLRDTFRLSELGFQSLIGNDKDYLASRTAYKLDLGGPSVGVQTACSTSLVAVHLACQSLLAGETEIALAGGATVKTPQGAGYTFQEGGLFSPDGHCRPFDAAARGTIFGNGVGVVVLRRLADAIAAGDRIYAVILGSAVNNDGAHKIGYTAPSEDGQVRVISEALSVAGVEPETVGYVETHGTGTALGDPIEIAALRSVFRRVPPGRRCALGAVKSNFGHLESAAGVAGLIKTALALHHGEIPPTLHFERPNPQIDFERSPFFVNTERRAWPALEGPRRAGVSSFGIGGTNAHVVLEQAPPPPTGRGRAVDEGRAQLLPISARSPAALRALAAAYRERLAGLAAPAAHVDLAASAAMRRSHLPHRLALVLPAAGANPAARLGAFLDQDERAGREVPGLAVGRPRLDRRPRVVFVFPGQGSQWPRMGLGLLAGEPAFREAFEQCAAAIERHAGWSLREVLAAPEGASRLDELDVVQPALFALGVSLARLWQAWGIEPAAVIGHSMGDVAAACCAGALSIDDAARVICHRSRLALEVRGRGGMLLVELPFAEARRSLEGNEDRLAVAASNSPRATVLSGDDAALDELAARLTAEQVFCRRVQVDFASHSPQVDVILPKLPGLISGLSPRAGKVPLYSAVGQARRCDGSELDVRYWQDNLRQPVMLADAVALAEREGHDLFLEVSPHPVLVPSLLDCLRDGGPSGESSAVFASLRRQEDERERMLETLGQLYVRGCQVDWRKVAPEGRPFVALPAMPWQRQRYWIDAPPAAAVGGGGLASRAGAGDADGLLGVGLRSAFDPDSWFWQLEVSTHRFPYLAEHRVQGSVVVPAALILELALAAGQRLLGGQGVRLEAVALHRVLLLGAEDRELVQVAVTPEGPGRYAFRVASAPLAGGTGEWTLRADGRLGRLASAGEAATPRVDLDALRARMREPIAPADHYADRQSLGFDYGDAYRGLVEIWRGDSEGLGRLELPASLATEAGAETFHPALLDAALQLFAAAVPVDEERALYLPVGFDEVEQAKAPGDEMWVHAILGKEHGARGSALAIYDASGELVLAVRGFNAKPLDREGGAELEDWLFDVEWLEREPPAVKADAPARRFLLLAGADPLAAALAARLRGRGDTCVEARIGGGFERHPDGTYTVAPEKPDDLRELWREVSKERPVDGVLYLWGLASTMAADAGPGWLELAAARSCDGLLHLLQAVFAPELAAAGGGRVPRLLLLSRGVHAIAGDAPPDPARLAAAVAQAPAWGIGAVLANEHPELAWLSLDLSPDETGEAELDQLVAAFDCPDESRLALRGSRCFAARLRQLAAGPGQRVGSAGATSPAGDRPYRLAPSRPGDLGSLTLRALPPPPRPVGDQVLIEVRAAGLNFKDVLSTLDPHPDPAHGPVLLGSECAGVVVACGPDAADLEPGDEVVAAARGSFGRLVLAPRIFTVRKPANLDFAQAAGLPVSCMTAWYALVELARLQPGERVLVHSAATGTGLAALTIAQALGAKVFASAGQPQKRELLRSLGVELVMDSRSLDFADRVLAATGGEGVDVVISALTGEAVVASLELLAPHGRFLELGLREIRQNRALGLRPFRKNISYHAIDLARMMAERPRVISALLAEVMARFERGELAPPPLTTFPLSRASAAFETMARAEHVGRLVLVADPDPAAVDVEPSSPGEPAWEHGAALAGGSPAGGPPRGGAAIRPDGSYLLTGGLGGLGLVFARWLVEQGAGAVVLAGRRPPAGAAAQVVEELRQGGATVRVLAVDVGDAAALADALASLGDLPPLRGVLHAAGVLEDAPIERQSAASFRRVLRPKLGGAWNLHRLTAGLELDFWVLFSSTVSLFGLPGQSNYAAANFALDVLASQRRAAGLPALAIAWGAFREVGLAAPEDPEAARLQEERLRAGGFSSLAPGDGPRALARLLGRPEAAAVAVVPFALRTWRANDPRAASAPLFAALAAAAGLGDAPIGSYRATLLALPPAERQAELESFLAGLVAGALRIEPAAVSLDAALAALGLDSLMALGVRNRIEYELGLPVPIVQLLQSPDLRQLAGHLLQRIVLEQVLAPAAPAAAGDDDEWEVVSL